MIDTTAAARSLAPWLLTDEPQPRLLGGRHRETGRIVFPHPEGGETALYEPYPLRRDGLLWSWTIQRFRPKSPPYAGPDTFEPFAIGYVELPGETIIETRIADADLGILRIGLPVRLAIIPFATDPDGTIVTTFAFCPQEHDA